MLQVRPISASAWWLPNSVFCVDEATIQRLQADNTEEAVAPNWNFCTDSRILILRQFHKGEINFCIVYVPIVLVTVIATWIFILTNKQWWLAPECVQCSDTYYHHHKCNESIKFHDSGLVASLQERKLLVTPVLLLLCRGPWRLSLAFYSSWAF
jgi:hypothetical protein